MKSWTVYRHYDANGACLRIGCTCNLPARNAHYKSQTTWWTQVTRTKTVTYREKQTALSAEVAAIQKERPLQNNFNGRTQDLNAYQRAWYAKNRQKQQARDQRRREARRAYFHNYKLSHREARNAKDRARRQKRRAEALQSSPPASPSA